MPTQAVKDLKAVGEKEEVAVIEVIIEEVAEVEVIVEIIEEVAEVEMMRAPGGVCVHECGTCSPPARR